MSQSSLSPDADFLPAWNSGNFLGEVGLSLYGAVGDVAGPIARMLLRRREARGKEDPARRNERFGIPGRPRPAGPLVWVHAASVGETVAAVPLIERIAGLGPKVLLTTGTVTAAQIAERRLEDIVVHQFMPIDMPAAVDRFLDHWRPHLVLFVESELWPTTLNAVSRRNLPIAVINARMSERSFRAWRRSAPFARAVVGRPDLFLAQTPMDADRLRSLGATRVMVCGNLKFDTPPPPADETALGDLRQQIGARFVLVAASTHPGEEAVILDAHAELARRGASLLTILAPRHPERGAALASEAAAAGFTLSRRSRGERINADTDVYLADTIGEMGLWYRLAHLAFLGGSMVPRGGQNPIEAAKLRVPVVHGRHVSNFREIYDALAAARAVEVADDSATLAAVAMRLIGDDHVGQRLAREAFACVQRFTGALDRTTEALDPYLAKLARTDEAAPRT
jgi:3-deoxy-D-manno-octulosonic-acid transferase